MSGTADAGRTGRSRRRFLKEAGAAVAALGWGLPLLAPGCGAGGGGGGTASPGRQWALVVDVARCRNGAVRKACIDACHAEHNVPSLPDPEEEVKWIWSAEAGKVFPDMVHGRSPEGERSAPVLVTCNHCTDPPCTKVCPTGATWKRESDGIVMMDMHRCIGCRYCMAACPYGSRSFNWRDPRPFVAKDASGEPISRYPTRTRGVVEKCDFCAERLAAGRAPACVEAAASVEGGAGALVFGDCTDPLSEVSRTLRERRTVTRRASLGTGPNVYYAM